MAVSFEGFGARFGLSGRWFAGALALLTPALMPAAAQADARDDVVAGMMHCAVIADDRQWLECYYGAAQPMRGRLGLPPAPQSQQQLLQQYYSARPASPGYGAPLAPMPGGAQYAPQYAPQMASQAPVPSGPPPMPKDRGMFSDFFGGSTVVRNSPVQDYKFNPDGSFVITLADGQVWEQLGDDYGRHPAKWTDPASAMRVSISEGAMRTYNLTVNGNDSVQYKVHRLR